MLVTVGHITLPGTVDFTAKTFLRHLLLCVSLQENVVQDTAYGGVAEAE